jgi:pimeloyl-ACP methyl ester carboxylesterase
MTNWQRIRVIALGLALAACGTGPAASTAPAATMSQIAAIASPTSVVTGVPTPEVMPTTPALRTAAVTPAAAAATPSLEEGTLVDVGGYSLWIRCTGEGRPTVVMTPNVGQAVEEAVADFTRMCLYHPAGVELSDPPPGPRTSAALAGDLHTLLGKAGVPGPYVIVRPALGTFTALSYADQYPKEAAGLVLVDTVPPDVVLSSKDPFWSDPLLNQDLLDYKRSAREAKSIETLGGLPLVVISQGKADLPEELQTTPKAWQRGQVQLSRLSTNSVHVVATRSGNDPNVDQPELVVEAINQVVEAAHAKKPLPPCGEALEELGGRCVPRGAR